MTANKIVIEGINMMAEVVARLVKKRNSVVVHVAFVITDTSIKLLLTKMRAP